MWLRFHRRGPVEIVWHDLVDRIADTAEKVASRRRGQRPTTPAKKELPVG